MENECLHTKFVKEEKKESLSHRKENDNGKVDNTILWDAMKVVMWGKVISRTAHLKKELYQKKISELKNVEQKYKKSNYSGILQQLKDARTKVNEILGDEVERKMSFSSNKRTMYRAPMQQKY